MTLPAPHEKLRPPAAVLEITRALESAGYQAWCVGGAVRDALLGLSHLDWDLATNATPDQVRQVFGRKRTIPKGIEYGTVGILDPGGILHEVTTFRRDVRTDGRHAEVEFGASLDEDLARRDFTINAIAFSPSEQRLYDPFQGRADMALKLVRAVGDPAERMREDRLRALRALRFAARFDFEIDPATWEGIRGSAPHLTRLSAERVREEIEKTMDQVAAPSHAFSLWRASGALAVLVPELGDLSDEVLRALDCAAQPGPARKPGRRLNRLAVLFSDVSSDRILGAAKRLRFSNPDAQWIAAIGERWQSVAAEMTGRLGGQPDGASVRRWVARVGRTRLGAFFRVASARWEARRALGLDGGAPAARAVHSLYRRCLEASLGEPVELSDLAVDGDDLRRVGIAPGPGLGKILGALLDAVLEDPARNTQEWLLAKASRLNAGRDDR